MCILNHVPGAYEEHSIDRGGEEQCRTGRYALLPCFGWVKLCDVVSWVKSKVTENNAPLPAKLFDEKICQLFAFFTLNGGID